MAEALLTNVALISGLYGSEPISFLSGEAETTILSGISATKTADKTVWLNGPLTYTITVSNTLGGDLTGVVLTDELSPLITFSSDFGVLVDGTPLPSTDYSFVAGVLSINLPVLEDGSTTVVTFQVLQV